MKIAVIGGGVFGSTAAIYAARAGHEVHLYEALEDVLQAASAINQYRLHRGYHYPRSSQTALAAIEAERSFRLEYPDAVIDAGTQLYAIAREKSRVTGEQFLAFCDEQGLSYELIESCGLVNHDMVEIVLRATESRFDPDILRALVKQKLEEAGVYVHVGTPATPELMQGYEKVVIAAYAANSSLIGSLTGMHPEYQYEVCEKPVVTLPDAFGRTGLVVMDGPFMCVDPLGTSDRFVLGNVVHAIHAANVGAAPVIPEPLAALLNRGLIEDPSVTKFADFVETGAQYIPMLAEATHVGSLYTVRTVLPHLDATDARPTMVTALDDKHIKIFSGKIGNCVAAAREVVALLDDGRVTRPEVAQIAQARAHQSHRS